MEFQMCLGHHLRDCVLCCLAFEEKVFGLQSHSSLPHYQWLHSGYLQCQS